MKRARSAKSGRFVTRLFARSHPATTVEETDHEFHVAVPPGCSGVVLTGRSIRFVRFEFEDPELPPQEDERGLYR